MDRQLQTTELLLAIATNTSQILKRLDFIENKFNQVKKSNDFNIDTFEKASKKLKCSISTLRTAIKNNILIENIHYRYNGKKKYLFSISALENIKGNL